MAMINYVNRLGRTKFFVKNQLLSSKKYDKI